MSSPEFAGLQGISGTAVAKRCALLVSPAKQQLLWFIQGMSLADGGLKRLARELLKMFPERICVDRIRFECCDPLDDADPPPDAELRQECHNIALRRQQRSHWGQELLSIEEFLIDLCINPRLTIPIKGEEIESSEFDVDLARDKFPELALDDFRPADLKYFKEVIGAIIEYKRRYEEQVRAGFCHTAISREIWEQLDFALKTKRMIVLQGREGRGKTEAVRAWCNCHLGVARFMSLKGRSTMTEHFREFARALGVGHARSHTIAHMEANIEDVLQASHLMPVVDEAHFAFSQGPRMRTRPEMLDWIDTALCNPPLPVALVTTPHFMDCVERAVHQIGWNYLQFKRRCKRYRVLPAKNTPEDIEVVARHLLPEAGAATIKEVLGYTAMSKRDLSAVGDVVREAKLLAEEEGARRVTFEHVKRAIHEVLIVSDVPWAEMEKRLQHRKLGRKAPREAPALDPEPSQEPPETRGRDISPRLLSGASGGSRMRFQEPVVGTAGTPEDAILAPV
jgi:hypothetical protein